MMEITILLCPYCKKHLETTSVPADYWCSNCEKLLALEETINPFVDVNIKKRYIKKWQEASEILGYYNKLKEYTGKLNNLRLNELIDDFEKRFVSYLRREKEKRAFGMRRPGPTDLTWDEKNPAIYVSKPLDIAALEKFVEDEERKLNNRRKQQNLENSKENK